MPAWLNRTVGTATRNGTNSHTLTFSTFGDAPFTPTDGRLLVVIMGGSVTHSWPGGWTEQLQPVNNSELSVATITASSTTSVTVTHNASNYPVQVAVYEFPAGTTWVSGASASNQSGLSSPTVTGLPGTPVTVMYALVGARNASQSAAVPVQTMAWTSPAVENVELDETFSTTEGSFLGVAYTDGVTATSASAAFTITGSGSGFVGSTSERVAFALDVPSGGSSVSGTAVGTIGGLTGVASGVRKTLGTVAGTIGGLTGASTGKRTVYGVGGAFGGTAVPGEGVPGEMVPGSDGDGALGGLVGAATGQGKRPGTAAGTIGGLAGVASGVRKVLGTAASTSGGLSGVASGVRKVLGAAASTIGGLTGAAVGAGDTTSETGTATGTIGGLTGAASGRRTVRGVLTGLLGGLAGRAVVSDPTPPGPPTAEPASWGSALTLVREARNPPRFPETGCPNDGTPLQLGPRNTWYCPFCGYRR